MTAGPLAAQVVSVRGLHVRFGEVEAVRGIDLAAYAGRATALLGRNGAGKSTTMRVLAGVVPPSAGSITVAGLDIRTDVLAIKRLVGYCPDVGGLVPRATPWEHLQLTARLRRVRDWEPRARDLLERFDLSEVAHRVTSGFSHGMGRRLSVVLATFHEPPVLLLDEPFDGVDPTGVAATLEVIGGPANAARASSSRPTCVSWRCGAAPTRWCCAVARPSPAWTRPTSAGRTEPMSTALSWTERPGGRSGPADRLVDPVRDLAALVRFRSSGLGARGRDRMRVAAAGAVLLTLAAAVVPAHLPGAATYAGHDTVAGRLVTALPAIYLGFVLLAVLTAAASGGGRELVARASRPWSGRSPRPPTTSLRCCWPRSTSPGCWRRGRCSG